MLKDYSSAQTAEDRRVTNILGLKLICLAMMDFTDGGQSKNEAK